MGGILGFFVLLAASPDAAASTLDIIVTGEKRSTPLQETTSSVAVTTARMIEDRSLREVQEIYGRTANVSQAFGPGAFSIRGIINSGVTGGGESPTATVYLDGMPMASTYLQAAPTQLWDVASVEIIRGPQSTVQGLNALAGAVVIRSADPSLIEWDSRARLLVTSEPQGRLSYAVGGPMDKDELAFKLTGDVQSRGGFTRNLTRNAAEDRENAASVRAKLLWQPSHWPSLEFRLGYTHAQRKGPYFTSYARTDAPRFTANRVTTDNVANTTELRFDGAILNAAYAMADEIKLISDSSWSSVRETSQFDGDYGPANAAFSNQERTYRTFTQELRLTVNRNSLKAVAGLFFYDRALASKTISRTAVPTPISTIAGFLRANGAGPAADSIARAYGEALPSVSVDFDGSFPTHIRSYAAYGDARVPIVSRLSLIVGFRAEREQNDSQTIQRAAFAGVYPNPISFGSLAPVISQINGAVGSLVSQANGTLPPSRRSFEAFLPKGGIAIDLTDKIEAAIVVQKAYRSGGTSGNIARGQVYAYDPEYTWNYEGTFRSSLMGGRMRLNANAFYVDWRNQQVAVNFGLNAYDVNTVNAGKSHLYGFEMEAFYQIDPEWTAYLSAGHTQTKFDQFTVPGLGVPSNLSGSEFPFAPQWTIAGGTDLRLNSGWGGSVNGAYASRSFGAAGINQTAYRISPHTIMNVRLGYSAPRWSAHIVGANIFNEGYVMFKSPAESRAVLNAPRTVGLELNARY